MTVKAVFFCAVPWFVLLAIFSPLLWWAVFSACLAAGFLSLLCRPRLTKPPELQHLRARLAADLHDDIGANLSQIAVLTEVLRRQTQQTHPHLAHALDAIARISGETVDAMSDIVWATNPKHDALTNLIPRMRRVASEVLPAARIEFSFAAPDLPNDWRLAGELRRQVFLIFKESLNNIVRHARCTQVSIEVRLENAHLLLQVRDNGRGFTAAHLSAGNGLPNLHRRAQAIGAELTISSISSGTTILLRAPLGHPAGSPELQAVTNWLRSGQRQLQSAWQGTRSYLNRGVTGQSTRTTLPLQSAIATFTARREARRRVL